MDGYSRRPDLGTRDRPYRNPHRRADIGCGPGGGRHISVAQRTAAVHFPANRRSGGEVDGPQGDSFIRLHDSRPGVGGLIKNKLKLLFPGRRPRIDRGRYWKSAARAVSVGHRQRQSEFGVRGDNRRRPGGLAQAFIVKSAQVIGRSPAIVERGRRVVVIDVRHIGLRGEHVPRLARIQKNRDRGCGNLRRIIGTDHGDDDLGGGDAAINGRDDEPLLHALIQAQGPGIDALVTRGAGIPPYRGIGRDIEVAIYAPPVRCPQRVRHLALKQAVAVLGQGGRELARQHRCGGLQGDVPGFGGESTARIRDPQGQGLLGARRPAPYDISGGGAEGVGETAAGPGR